MGNNSKPMRILHVVGGMDRGGVETWLMHVLRHLDRDRFNFDFCTHTTKSCVYDEEIRELGCKIIPCLHPSRPWQYARNFRRLIGGNGPYDIIHSHVHHFSGFVLYLAKKVGIPVRYAHSHNDILFPDGMAGLFRRFYLGTMKLLIRNNATAGFSCSTKAAQALYGVNWHSDPRWNLLYYGIDLDQFSVLVKKEQVRDELGIPVNAFVVGHVGRFAEQKNHTFLLDILSCLVKCDPNTWAVLVGEGPLRIEMENKVKVLGLENHTVFTGVLSDIPRILLGAVDVFLLPSLYEGLGLVLVEAQAAGLPCFLSDVVPEEADVVPDLITRISTSGPPELWANRILAVRKKPCNIQLDVLDVMKDSKFNIVESVKQLCESYSSE